MNRMNEKDLLSGGLLCIWISYLDTSKTSTRVGKKEAKKESFRLLVIHIFRIVAALLPVKALKNL